MNESLLNLGVILIDSVGIVMILAILSSYHNLWIWYQVFMGIGVFGLSFEILHTAFTRITGEHLSRFEVLPLWLCKDITISGLAITFGIRYFWGLEHES